MTPDPYHLASFTHWMRSWGASLATMDARLVVARQAASYWPDPDLVTGADVSMFLGHPGYAAWTRTTYYGHLHSLFGWLAQRGDIAADPTTDVRRPKPPRNSPRPLTPGEAALVLRTASARMRTWLLLGLYAGLRAHETAKIQGRDVSEEAIYVRGKGGKDALVPTHPLIWVAAQKLPAGFWFPSGRGSIAATSLSAAVTAHFRANGVEGSYHRCRHAYGTGLLRAGVNLRITQTLMRHESLTSTAAYLAVDEDERTAAIRLLAA